MKKEPVKTITLKVSENTMNKMNEYFEDKKRIKTPPYAVFQADEADTVVTLYQSGKAVFQGISADIDANLWSQMEKKLNPNKKDGKSIEVENVFAYYIKAGISGASISIRTHDNEYVQMSLGIKGFKKFVKYEVDVLGQYHEVKLPEKRMPFNIKK